MTREHEWLDRHTQKTLRPRCVSCGWPVDICGHSQPDATDRINAIRKSMWASISNTHMSPQRMTTEAIRRLAEDIDFAIDVTEPREARLGRFEELIIEALASPALGETAGKEED